MRERRIFFWKNHTNFRGNDGAGTRVRENNRYYLGSIQKNLDTLTKILFTVKYILVKLSKYYIYITKNAGTENCIDED
jgi:hypothetical protein